MKKLLTTLLILIVSSLLFGAAIGESVVLYLRGYIPPRAEFFTFEDGTFGYTTNAWQQLHLSGRECRIIQNAQCDRSSRIRQARKDRQACTKGARVGKALAHFCQAFLYIGLMRFLHVWRKKSRERKNAEDWAMKKKYQRVIARTPILFSCIVAWVFLWDADASAPKEYHSPPFGKTP